MKRFLSILLIALMLVSAVSVTAFADNTYQLDGVWKFKDTISKNTSINQSINFTSYGNQFTGIKYDDTMSSIGILCIKYLGTGSINSYFYQDTNGYMQKEYGNWTREDYLTVDFGVTPQTVSASFYSWFTSNATKIGESEPPPPPECNGSSCHIKDVDFDDVCDTCGGTVVMSMRSTSAVEGTHFVVYGIAYPLEYRTSSTEGSVEEVFQRYHEQSNEAYAFIFKDGNTTYLRITDSDLFYNNGYLVFNKTTTDEKTYKYTQYTLGDDYWAYSGEFTIKSDTRFYPTTLYATQTTIFDLNVIPYMVGEGFFQPPPLTPTDPTEITGVQEMGAEIIRVMMIVATVAVSCLALLVSFLILLKVLRRFLKR